jgi:acyl carrier protein
VEANTDLRRRVLEIVAEVAEVPLEKIPPDALLADLDIDSLRALRIVAEVERRWGIVIGEEEIGAIRSMPDILALVERKSPRG